MKSQSPLTDALVSRIASMAEENHIARMTEGAVRYEAIRKLNPRQFTKLWEKALKGPKSFDQLVDELTVKKQ
jgi:hypothetical protein